VGRALGPLIGQCMRCFVLAETISRLHYKPLAPLWPLGSPGRPPGQGWTAIGATLIDLGALGVEVTRRGSRGAYWAAVPAMGSVVVRPRYWACPFVVRDALPIENAIGVSRGTASKNNRCRRARGRGRKSLFFKMGIEEIGELPSFNVNTVQLKTVKG
jgi:hypothetical protein